MLEIPRHDVLFDEVIGCGTSGCEWLGGGGCWYYAKGWLNETFGFANVEALEIGF